MAENETARTDAALDFSGRTVAFAGRLASLSRRIAARAIEARGGIPRLALTRRTDILAVGHGSYGLLETGRLQHLLDRAGRFGAACVSENALLRALELLPDPRHEQRTIAIEDIAALSRLELSAVRALVLFDVIEPWQDRCAFRDLITARTAFRLLQDQLSLPTVIAALLKFRRRTGAGTTPPPIPNLVRDGRNGVVIDIGGALAELNGQLRLPLSEFANPSLEEIYESAEEAEDSGDWTEAARLYRRCLDLDRSDPSPAFNLANVLCRLGRAKEAKLYLWMAVGIDPTLADAWYNMAHVLEAEGDIVAARAHLRRAIEAEPTHGDAIYNLAHLCWESGDYAEATSLWQRYLATDAESDWARKARHGIALCRMHLNVCPASAT